MRVIAALYLCAWCALPAFAQAQTVTVSGTVIDAGTRAPIAGAVVSGAAQPVTADPKGVFAVMLPPGRRTIEVVAPGYFPLVTTLDVGEAGVSGAELALARDSGFVDSVAVVAAAPAIAPATQTVAPIQVLRTPGALDNIFRTLQTLPGVTATEEFGSRLAVRGGSPDQNLTVMDGVEIHDPYRLFGLTSAFNPETIQRFELATGGFSVKYGDRLSSLLSVENRDGTRDEKPRRLGHRSASPTPTSSLEGALPRRARVVAGHRRAAPITTWWRRASPIRTSRASPTCRARWSGSSRPGSKLSVFGLRSRQSAAITIDEDDARGEFKDDTRNDLAWVRFDCVARQPRAIAHHRRVFEYALDVRRRCRVREHAASARTHRARRGFGIANVIFDRTLSACATRRCARKLSWSLGAHVVDAGGEAHRLSTALPFEVDGDRNPSAANGSSAQGGAGLPDSADRAQPRRPAPAHGCWTRGRSARAPSLEAGLRVDRAGITGETLLSPRVARPVRWARHGGCERRDRPLHAESRLREARAERLRARSWQRRRRCAGSESRCMASLGIERRSAGRCHGARRGLLQAFQPIC